MPIIILWLNLFFIVIRTDTLWLRYHLSLAKCKILSYKQLQFITAMDLDTVTKGWQAISNIVTTLTLGYSMNLYTQFLLQ